jgi:hypothetical protein
VRAQPPPSFLPRRDRPVPDIIRRPKSERSEEANTLRADLKAGRLMKQALWQARLAYQFAPSAYTFEALSAIHRLKQRLQERLPTAIGEDAADSSSPTSPEQRELL